MKGSVVIRMREGVVDDPGTLVAIAPDGTEIELEDDADARLHLVGKSSLGLTVTFPTYSINVVRRPVKSTGPRPGRTAQQAAAEALSLVGTGRYKLGALDSEATASIYDCSSFAIRHCYKLPGHRPGFNRGWKPDANFPQGATVVDDINTNSAIEDAFHEQELFELVRDDPRVGDLLAYPTIRIPGIKAGPWIGHVLICVGTGRVRSWDPTKPKFSLLDVVECHGPNGTLRAIRKNTGAMVDSHNATWPKVNHRGHLLRVKP